MTNPFFLAPNLQLEWSARGADFVREWQRRLWEAEAAQPHDEDQMIDAALSVMMTVQQRHDRTAETLMDLYHVSRQLPALGDVLIIEPLELRVDERRFVPSHVAGIPCVTIVYCFGIERYRYGNSLATNLLQSLPSVQLMQ